MNLILQNRRVRIWILLGALQAIVGFAALEIFETLHHLTECECPAEEAGQPCSCVVCNHLTTLQVVAPATLAVAPPNISGITDVCSAADQDDPTSLPTAARSPPHSV